MSRMKPTEEFLEKLYGQGFKVGTNYVSGDLYLERVGKDTFTIGIKNKKGKLFNFDVITVDVGDTVTIENLNLKYQFDIEVD